MMGVGLLPETVLPVAKQRIQEKYGKDSANATFSMYAKQMPTPNQMQSQASSNAPPSIPPPQIQPPPTATKPVDPLPSKKRTAPKKDKTSSARGSLNSKGTYNAAGQPVDAKGKVKICPPNYDLVWVDKHDYGGEGEPSVKKSKKTRENAKRTPLVSPYRLPGQSQNNESDSMSQRSSDKSSPDSDATVLYVPPPDVANPPESTAPNTGPIPTPPPATRASRFKSTLSEDENEEVEVPPSVDKKSQFLPRRDKTPESKTTVAELTPAKFFDFMVSLPPVGGSPLGLSPDYGVDGVTPEWMRPKHQKALQNQFDRLTRKERPPDDFTPGSTPSSGGDEGDEGDEMGEGWGGYSSSVDSKSAKRGGDLLSQMNEAVISPPERPKRRSSSVSSSAGTPLELKSPTSASESSPDSAATAKTVPIQRVRATQPQPEGRGGILDQHQSSRLDEEQPLAQEPLDFQFFREFMENKDEKINKVNDTPPNRRPFVSNISPITPTSPGGWINATDSTRGDRDTTGGSALIERYIPHTLTSPSPMERLNFFNRSEMNDSVTVEAKQPDIKPVELPEPSAPAPFTFSRVSEVNEDAMDEEDDIFPAYPLEFMREAGKRDGKWDGTDLAVGSVELSQEQSDQLADMTLVPRTLYNTGLMPLVDAFTMNADIVNESFPETALNSYDKYKFDNRNKSTEIELQNTGSKWLTKLASDYDYENAVPPPKPPFLDTYEDYVSRGRQIKQLLSDRFEARAMIVKTGSNVPREMINLANRLDALYNKAVELDSEFLLPRLSRYPS